MDRQRAREIMQSAQTISVSYQGSPVWLESLNDSGNTVEVTILDRKEKAKLPLSQLVEKP